MLRQLLQRVLYTLPVIWLVVSLVFVLIHLVPGDPIQQMLGEGAPPADIEATRHAYGLDARSEEHTSELQSHLNLVCRLLLEKKKHNTASHSNHQAPPITLRLTLPSAF